MSRYLGDYAVRALQNAFYHEYRNSMIYSYVSLFLKNKGLENLSKYYSDWSKEEKEHSDWVREFMSAMDIPLTDGDVLIKNIKLDTPADFIELTVSTEDQTTKLYNDMWEMASGIDDLGSAMLLAFLNKIQKEQIEETDKALTLYAQVRNLNDWGLLQLFDNSYK